MNAAKQAIWLFFALILLACSGWYFASSEPIVTIDNKSLSKEADTIINNVILKRFDSEGRIVNYLKTPEIKHIPDNNRHLFKEPQILVSQADQPDWEISSKLAEAINGGEQITFNQDVLIHQAQSEHGQESTMQTQQLHYFPKTKIASTEHAVRFEQPGSVVHSQGMKAYLADKRIQLLSKARATYEPKHA